jgi:hypothetical protein
LSCLSYRGELVRPARFELACLEHSLLRAACLPIPPRAYGADPRTCTEKQLRFKPARSAHSHQIREGCQAPDSHREAVRFELTRYANSRQLGGTRGQSRTDTWRLRRSPPFPSARVWRPELDSNQHRRLRRPSTGPSAGANWSGRTESNRPVPRWQRCRAPCAPASFGSCRRICTCCLRLIRSVLICMSFAAIDWSEWLDSNQRSRAPEARALVQTEPHSEVGQDGRTCTCGFRVPGSAVCC